MAKAANAVYIDGQEKNAKSSHSAALSWLDQNPILAVAIFASAVLLASVGVLYLPVALGFAVVLMILTGIIPLRQIYQSVEWPVIVLLGSMIPIGVALESSGGTAMIASGIVDTASNLSPAAVMVVLALMTAPGLQTALDGMLPLPELGRDQAFAPS